MIEPSQTSVGLSVRPDAVSIIVPAYNAARTIERTLRSVAAQTSSRWEVIVVDDGSSDDTAIIVQHHADADARLHLVSQQPAGVSAARNTGLRVATGAWVLFLDADDTIGPTYIEQALAAVAADPTVDAVRARWAYQSSTGRLDVTSDELSPDADLFAVAAQRCPFAIHALIVRRDLVVELDGFDETLAIGEDWDLWQRMARRPVNVAVLDEVHAVYVLTAGSAMRRDLPRVLSDCVRVVERGHAPDDRVAGASESCRAGAPPDGLTTALDTLVFWAVGLAATDPERVRGLLVVADPVDRTVFDPIAVSYTLFGTIPLGLDRVPAEWPEIWPSVAWAVSESVDLLAAWIGDPSIARAILRPLERLIAGTFDAPGPHVIGSTLLIDVALEDGLAAVRTAGAERLVCRVSHDGLLLGFVDVAVLADHVPAMVIDDAVARQLGTALLSAGLRKPALLRRSAAVIAKNHVVRRALRLALDVPGRGGLHRRDILKRFAVDLLRPATALASGDDPRSATATDAVDNDHAATDAAYWEAIFAEPDPWGYTNAYERLKYEQTLSAIGGVRAERVLELACAEGHFTVQLAPHVGHLLASDISSTALERASERCRDLTNVEFTQIDLNTSELPHGFDLVLCCEVLYYLERSAVQRLGQQIHDALRPGGTFVTTHANLLTDSPYETGFDWGHEHGSLRIGEILGATPGLHLRRELRSELYRIQLFERDDDAGASPPPATERIPIAELIDPVVARGVVWGGITPGSEHAFATEVSDQIPILTYHNIAESGPAQLARYRVSPAAFEQQLAWLRKNRYYGLSLDDLESALASHRAPDGRAVMLTFDDGYEDFHEAAWPLLEAYGFSATVFIVPTLTGTTSTWDAHFGDTQPLMSWPTIRRLQERGIEFGSHSSAHHALTGVAPRDALVQESSARESLKRELGRSVHAIAYPFGDVDETMCQVMRQAGHRIGMTTDVGHATVWDDPMRLPRITVAGEDDLAAFEQKLGRTNPRNVVRQGVRKLSGRLRR